MENLDPNLKVLIDEKTLQKRIEQLGCKITKDYENEELIVICILKGSLYFTSDLTKNIKNNKMIIDFMRVSSYGNEFVSSGNIKIVKDIEENITGKNILIVEDIVDSGNTLYNLKEYLKNKNPKSIKICTLLDKKARREKEIFPEYIGFEVEDKFIVGYGLDYKELYRNLPYIAYVEN